MSKKIIRFFDEYVDGLYLPEDEAPRDSKEGKEALKKAIEIAKYRDIAIEVLRGKISVSAALKKIQQRKMETSIYLALRRINYASKEELEKIGTEMQEGQLAK